MKRFWIMPMLGSICGLAQVSGLARGDSQPAAADPTEVVCYEDFGAVGDGRTDDFEALLAAHQHANENGLPVKAADGKSYYLAGHNKTIVIQTDTDFANAHFIIDDTAVENRRAELFLIKASQQAFPLSGISSLRRNQRTLPLEDPLPQSCIVEVENSALKHYIRFGRNQNKGRPQTDVFIIDQNGQVAPDSDILWDFDQITKITAQPIDSQVLTVTGGTFTTIANTEDSKYTYYHRGIAIERSNVNIDGLKHMVTGEGEQGAPYRGFIDIRRCAHVTVRNCILTGRKTYQTIGAAGKPVSMGSYDINVNRALNVSFINCQQTNDINDRNFWGIMGSNYCKNLLFEGCILSRFDAHMGVANATIRDCKLGHMGISVIGKGRLTVENTRVYARSFISLRRDYGSTWEGDLIIRNCVFIPAVSKSKHVSLLSGYHSGQHDFGYSCHMPETILIEALHIDDADRPENYFGPTVFGDFNPNYTDNGDPGKYPYLKTREVTLREVSSASGKPIELSANPAMFKDVILETGQP